MHYNYNFFGILKNRNTVCIMERNQPVAETATMVGDTMNIILPCKTTSGNDRETPITVESFSSLMASCLIDKTISIKRNQKKRGAVSIVKLVSLYVQCENIWV